MPENKPPRLSAAEKEVLRQIKYLTQKSAYGNIGIVIRAGLITAIQVTTDIRTDTGGQPQS